ncbi:hypothetical protein M9Y10_026475 [Tritrichomonas musculus]|uniref:Ankyrin repeat protein n=1 Tax=Tritrichomonas musculus TaxID=1915356 RepID=A0ABR2GL54_9EUKA
MEFIIKYLKNDDVDGFEQSKHALTSLDPNEMSKLPNIFYSNPNFIAYVAFYGAMNCFLSLQKQGESVDDVDDENRSAIHFACAGGNCKMVNMLIEDLDQFHNVDSLGRSPLHYAIEYNQNCITKFLVEKYTSDLSDCLDASLLINKKDIFGMTPFHLSVENENEEIVDYLIENGANVNLSDADGCVPVHIAAKIGSFQLLSKLIQKGAKANKKSKNGRTLFHFAAFSGSPWIINKIISTFKEEGDVKININTPDQFGRIPLHYACEQGSVSVVEELLKLHSDVNLRDVDGMLPIHFAAIKGNTDIIQLLIKYRSPVYAKDSNLRTPLHLACECGSYKAVRLLCRKFKNLVNEETKNGLTPLHSLASSDFDVDNADLVHYLVSKGSDINKKTKFGQTPLQCAIENGFLNTIGALVESGADLNIMNSSNSKGNEVYYSPKISASSSSLSSAFQSPCSSPNISRRSPTKSTFISQDMNLDELL